MEAPFMTPLFFRMSIIFENSPGETYNAAESRISTAGGFQLHDMGVDLPSLIERCNRGDADAQQEFYARYYGKVYKTVKRRCAKYSSEIDDIVQEVFCGLLAALKSYDRSRSIEAYILAITRNTAISHHRRSSAVMRGGPNHGTKSLPLNDDGDFPGIDSGFRNDNPEQLLSKAQERDLLRKALDALPDSCRKLIGLRFVEQISYGEISAISGQKEATLRSQAKRCLSSLAAIYAKLSLHKEGG